MVRRKLTEIIYFIICFLLIFEQSGFAQVAAQLDIASHLSAMRNALTVDKFRPLHLRYLQYDSSQNNFRLLIDKGTLKNPSNSDLENTSKDLLKYFFIGLSLPNDAFWVNLRPDSPDNIIDDKLAQTDIGRILLEADLELKKDTARATSPETPEGQEYWNKLYQKAEELFGSQNVTIPTLTRPWIVPDEIIIRETTDSAYIYKATLKVMLEQDYLKNDAVYNFKDDRLKQLNEYSSQLIRETIIPKLTKEVNTAKKYAPLRQVYYSLILSQWFKVKFAYQNTAYSRLIESGNITSFTAKTPFSKDTYFKVYQKSFKDGEYNFQTPVSTPFGQMIRSYFSGGFQVGNLVPQNTGTTVPTLGGGSTTRMAAQPGDGLLRRARNFLAPILVLVGINAANPAEVIVVTQDVRPTVATLNRPKNTQGNMVATDPHRISADTMTPVVSDEEYYGQKGAEIFRLIKSLNQRRASLSIEQFVNELFNIISKDPDFEVRTSRLFVFTVLDDLLNDKQAREAMISQQRWGILIKSHDKAAVRVAMTLVQDTKVPEIAGFKNEFVEVLTDGTIVVDREAIRRTLREAGFSGDVSIVVEEIAGIIALHEVTEVRSLRNGRTTVEAHSDAMAAEAEGLQGKSDELRKAMHIIWQKMHRSSDVNLKKGENAWGKGKEGYGGEGRQDGVNQLVDVLSLQFMTTLQEKYIEKYYRDRVYQRDHETQRTNLLMRIGVKKHKLPLGIRLKSLFSRDKVKQGTLSSVGPLPDRELFLIEERQKQHGFGGVQKYYTDSDGFDTYFQSTREFGYEEFMALLEPYFNIPRTRNGIQRILRDMYIDPQQYKSLSDSEIDLLEMLPIKDRTRSFLSCSLLRYWIKDFDAPSQPVYYDRPTDELGKDIFERKDGSFYVWDLDPQAATHKEERTERENILSHLMAIGAYIDSMPISFQKEAVRYLVETALFMASLEMSYPDKMRWVVSQQNLLLKRLEDDLLSAWQNKYPSLYSIYREELTLLLSNSKEPSSSETDSLDTYSLQNEVGSNNPSIDGLPDKKTSGIDGSASLPSIPGRGGLGGIDFRALPIVTQAIGNLGANINRSSLNRLSSVNLNQEWLEIERMVSSGITPSAERIKEYIQASCAKGEAGQDVDKIINCISDILRQEEERCCSTDATLRDILVVLEASRSSTELSQIFLGKTI